MIALNTIQSNTWQIREIHTQPKLREIDISSIKSEWSTSNYNYLVLVGSNAPANENKINIPSTFYDAVIDMVMDRMGDNYVKGSSYRFDYLEVQQLTINDVPRDIEQISHWYKANNQLVDDFKYKLFSIIPNLYSKLLNNIRLANQSTTYGVSVNQRGSAQIINLADAPNNLGFATSEVNELQYMSRQTQSIEKLAPIDIYSKMIQLVRTDVIDDCMRRFNPLFATFIRPIVDCVPVSFTDITPEPEEDEE